MDTWLRNNVVNPMATATPDQQKLWSQLFEMEPKDQETVREFAARRDDVLESIADISQSDFWTKGTLAEAFGFAHTEYVTMIKLILFGRIKIVLIGLEML